MNKIDLYYLMKTITNYDIMKNICKILKWKKMRIKQFIKQLLKKKDDFSLKLFFQIDTR